MSTVAEWCTCARCWDWIWPGEPTYTDAQGRTPVCAVCHARAAVRASLSRTDTDPHKITEEET